MSRCPDCGSTLGKDATKCRCGWKSLQAVLREEGGPRFTPCAGNPACRYPGRMFVTGLDPNQRLCVNHYYIALENGAKDADPPRRMLGVVAAPVAGRD